MSSTFFTADWHLGDGRFEVLGRPFMACEEMADRLVVEHNRVVAPDDQVFVIGDVLHQDAPAELLEQVSRFNGRLTLIRGNHDVLSDEEYLRFFERVVPEGEGVEFSVEGTECWLTHYPSLARADRFNLTGHVHAAWQVQRNSLNVGVDVHHFRPVSTARVAFFVKAICSFYDDDVWAGELAANRCHSDRGGRGSRWKGPRPHERSAAKNRLLSRVLPRRRPLG